jgi:hypothetical protein
VSLPWGVLCEHWQEILWEPAAVWPPSERWILRHDGDSFTFRTRG